MKVSFYVILFSIFIVRVVKILKLYCIMQIVKGSQDNMPSKSEQTYSKIYDSIASYSLIITWGGWLVYFFSGACSFFIVMIFFFLNSFKLWHGVFCNSVFAFILLPIFPPSSMFGTPFLFGCGSNFSHSCGLDCRRHNSIWVTPARWMKALVTNWIWAPTYF